MNKLTSFQFKNKKEYDQLILINSDQRVFETAYLDDISGTVTFNDMAQEKYIQSLEDQVLLLTDEVSGGIL